MEVKWSGFFTPYSQEKVKLNATESAGVYLLWVKLKNEKWKCFYAGQAKNIKQRLLNHLSDNEENDCIKENVSKYVCGFEYAIISKQADRDGAEKYLYNHYSPECNNVDPSAPNSDVELKNQSQIFLTILFNRTMLLAMLTFAPNPKIWKIPQ